MIPIATTANFNWVFSFTICKSNRSLENFILTERTQFVSRQKNLKTGISLHLEKVLSCRKTQVTGIKTD